MENSNQENLKKLVIEKSNSDVWECAKTEWDLIFIYDKKSSCVCGHGITENCEIENRLNKNKLIVGNVCINHFKEKHLSVSKTCRVSLKNVQKNRNSVNANNALLKLCVRLDILSKKEMDEYVKYTTGKGSKKRFDRSKTEHFSVDAEKFRVKINNLICFGFTHDRPHCQCSKYAKPRQNGINGSFFYSCVNWPGGCKYKKNCVVDNGH
jgi:hypothetical protein